MAVQLFKDGEVIYVEPKRLQSHIDQGWRLDEMGALPSGPKDDGSPHAEKKMLQEMKILPSIDNVVIGATRIAL